MTKHTCNCGVSIILIKYKIHLEMSITFRDYYEVCPSCNREINLRDLNDLDLIEQEYLC